jgi:23S rRNA-/tRNA-specific pseudouridylate synthase
MKDTPAAPFVSYLDGQSEPLDMIAAVSLCLGEESNPLRAMDLLAIGAVWSFENRSSNVANLDDATDDRNPDAASSGKWRRVRFEAARGAALPPGTPLRVYGAPRRFLGCYVSDWPLRLLHADSAYVVVDKPANLPCQPDNANLQEALPACALRALAPRLALKGATKGAPPSTGGARGAAASEPPARPLELLLVHRLDTNTEGCTVLARNRKAQAQFKQWLASRKVTKEYVCLVRGQRVGLGVKRHWMLSAGPGTASSVQELGYDHVVGPGPRLLRKTAPPPPGPLRRGQGLPRQGKSDPLAPCPAPLGLAWQPCVLEVLACEPFQLDSNHAPPPGAVGAAAAAAATDARWPRREQLYEARVRLVTGRTHQVHPPQMRPHAKNAFSLFLLLLLLLVLLLFDVTADAVCHFFRMVVARREGGLKLASPWCGSVRRCARSSPLWAPPCSGTPPTRRSEASRWTAPPRTSTTQLRGCPPPKPPTPRLARPRVPRPPTTPLRPVLGAWGQFCHCRAPSPRS